MGDIMLLQYAKAKNRFTQAWINQAREHKIPRVIEVDDGKGGTIQKTWIDQAEEEWLARSVEANRFEKLLAKDDEENGTNKTEFLSTEAKKYSIPSSWDDAGEKKLLIEDGQPAMSFIHQWLNSSHPNIEGVTMGDFITGNGFVLSYIDADGKSKILKISVKK